jgi:hypothetical protein
VTPKTRGGGTVGVAAMDTGRFSEFSVALGNLELPPGWKIEGLFNYDLAHARNEMVRTFSGDRLMFLDDDNTFHPSLVKNLAAWDVDIVAALYLQRKPPFLPMPRVDGEPIVLDSHPGLVEVHDTGGSGLMVHRRVFDALEPPWFDHGEDAGGEHESDDIHFCRRARAAGFKIVVDTSVWMGHLNVMKVSPHYDEGWSTVMRVGNHDVGRIR